MTAKACARATLLAVAFVALPPPTPAALHFPSLHYDADVLISAGHEGRPDCDLEPPKLCNNTGTPGEVAFNAVVANEAADVLRRAGLRVIRRPAYIDRAYRVKDAIFVHFDGSASACASNASVGYPDAAKSRSAAQDWKRLYGASWPYGFQPDNFTDSLRNYYAFKKVAVSDAALVIEGGELTCPPQARWVAAHLKWEGDLIAYFVSRRLGKGRVGEPAVLGHQK